MLEQVCYLSWRYLLAGDGESLCVLRMLYAVSAIRYTCSNIGCSLHCVNTFSPLRPSKEFLQRLDPESDEGSSGLELDLNTESAMDDFGSPNSSGIESGSEGDFLPL